MTNKNINGLTAATTPLAGTELVPVWDGATKKVTVANLTAGRAVDVDSLTATTTVKATTRFGIGVTPSASWLSTIKSAEVSSLGMYWVQANGDFNLGYNTIESAANTFSYKLTGIPVGRLSISDSLKFYSAIAGTAGNTITFTERMNLSSTGVAFTGTASATGIVSTTDATDASSTTAASLKTAGGLAVVKKTYIGDNIVPAAAKGINFSANTPAAGMTSQLLNWYEEGTWTPAYRAGAATFTYPSYRYGKYTRVGNMVTVFARIATSSISGGSPGDTIYIGGLPFASSSTAQIGVSLTFATAFNSNTPITAFLNQSTTEFNLHYRATTVSGVSQNTYADLLNGADKNDISFSFSYTV